MKFSDFEHRLRIDDDDLDRELVEHAELVYHVNRAAAHAAAEAKQFAADYAVRRREESDTKLTQAQIDREVDADPAMKRIRESAADWEALKEAFRNRGFMLSSLADIHVARVYTRDHVDEKDLRRRMQSARERMGNRRERL